MSRVALAVLLLLAADGAPGAQQKESSDLEAYLAGIRAAGISEVGRGQVSMVAGICCGATILDYRKDEASGQYWPSYMSATCPKPNADPPELEKWKKLRRSETDMLADKLKLYADADGSGFVTTAEASEFRDLVEFGYLVAQVNRDEGTSAALIARATGASPEDVARKTKTYDALARRIAEAGVTKLPEVTLTAD
ncbi:MAG TPA: hypothetical protein VF247_09545 [Candidatus Krumholzibacteria bacterium]